MLRIRNNQITDDKGRVLKTLSCPFKVSDSDLRAGTDLSFECKKCSRPVYDTDRMHEIEIVDLLNADPNACLKINRLNPIFSIDHSQE